MLSSHSLLSSLPLFFITAGSKYPEQCYKSRKDSHVSERWAQIWTFLLMLFWVMGRSWAWCCDVRLWGKKDFCVTVQCILNTNKMHMAWSWLLKAHCCQTRAQCKVHSYFDLLFFSLEIWLGAHWFGGQNHKTLATLEGEGGDGRCSDVLNVSLCCIGTFWIKSVNQMEIWNLSNPWAVLLDHFCLFYGFSSFSPRILKLKA